MRLLRDIWRLLCAWWRVDRIRVTQEPPALLSAEERGQAPFRRQDLKSDQVIQPAMVPDSFTSATATPCRRSTLRPCETSDTTRPS